ncbi:hypothetical protein JD844_031591 [Phrynosoma platyrhinos]|uniref:Peptidase S1 domain-containing protein n=1 Tax=Phrynosoma platyrhinos TaxID=52577 RepID=A0ABQ7T0U8_PHRPL|nr:hypothetical protein JD844_031591 [Phrynosoma platyrhinos]
MKEGERPEVPPGDGENALPVELWPLNVPSWDVFSHVPCGLDPSPLFPAECGTTYSKMPETTGGKDISLRRWPWQVALYLNGKHTCAGALVSQEWIVSAAHCMDR